MNETKYWLWLTLVFGPGSRRLWQLMNLFETAEEAYIAVHSGKIALELSNAELRNMRGCTLEQAELLQEQCRRSGIRIVDYSSEYYPPLLKMMSDPPAVLYYKGSLRPLIGRASVTAVGTRKASQYSLAAAEKICGELAEKGVVIVSGFAMGLDITSHIAAAERGCPTVCVMGCGVDVDYPKQNFAYRDKILSAGGVFISEFPPGTSPHPSNFPKRNRIMSALGRVTIVFEASEKSGSLITATLAAEQGRDVFCLPPADIFSGAWSGNAMLLREGASLLLNTEDITELFEPGTLYHDQVKKEALELIGGEDVRDIEIDEESLVPVPAEYYDEEDDAGTELPQKSADNSEEAPDISGLQLEGTQKAVAEFLAKGPAHADVIAQELGIDTGDLFIELTELEVEGIIVSLPGKIYKINK